jgi:hypothetical protein
VRDTAITDKDGRFSLDLYDDSKQEVRAMLSRDGEFSADGLATPGEDVVLTLKPGIGVDSVLVRVVAADGSSIPVAEATLHTDPALHSGHSSIFERVENGRVLFDIEDRDDGDRFVVIEWPAASNGDPLPWGSARVDDVKAGGSYDVRLPAERSISGFVFGPDGRGLAGVAVCSKRTDVYGEGRVPEPHATGWEWNSEAAVTTDAAGAFRIGRLGDREHWIFALPPPDCLWVAAVKARAGASDVRIALRAGIAPTIRVLDPDGKPVAHASVKTATTRASVSGRGWRLVGEATTGDDGTVRIAHLDPAAEYELSVAAPEVEASSELTMFRLVDGKLVPLESKSKRPKLADVVRPRWPPAETTITLDRGFEVSGVVRDTSGAPVANALVLCEAADGAVVDQTTKADGAFTFTGVRAGTVEVRAALNPQDLMHDGASGRAKASVAAGARDVVLVVSAGADLVVRIEGWADRRNRRTVQALVFPDGENSRGHTSLVNAYISEEGVARFRGLNASASYTLWVEPDGDGRMVFANGFKAGGSEVHATLVVGKAITGRITVPDGATSVSVGAIGLGVTVEGVAPKDGSYEVRGLPDGRWVVFAGATVQGLQWVGKADAAAGGTADIALAPMRPTGR